MEETSVEILYKRILNDGNGILNLGHSVAGKNHQNTLQRVKGYFLKRMSY